MSNAEAWITGEYPNQKLNLKLPTGATGPIGPVGPVGPASTVPGPANTLTVLDTVTGPETPGATGPQGIQGAKGDPGGIVTGTLLNATDLNTITASGVYRQDNGSNITLAKNYPEATGETGILIVHQASGTSFIEQQWYPSDAVRNSRVFWTRSYNYGVWRPWRAYSSSRVDTTAGRAIYEWDVVNNREQLTYGDTGWRNVTALAGTGWAAGTMLVRRTNATVEFLIDSVTLSGTAPNTTLCTLPVGFRATYAAYMPAIHGPTRGSRSIYVSAAGDMGFNNAGNSEVMLTRLVWTTSDNWPTTLPGSAVGSIPNL